MASDDFGIESLAAYLHLTPQQVTRLAGRDKLPGRKVAGQWRFSRAEIHHWLEERIGLSDEDDLLDVADVLRPRPGAMPDDRIVLAEMLSMEAIEIPLLARTRNAVFSAIVEVGSRTGLLWDPKKMAEAVRAREELHPTTLGNGVALLHPRRPMPSILGEAFVALGLTPNGIPFGGGQGGLTDVFFLLCSVEDRGHLRSLSRLTQLIGLPGFLESLRQAPDRSTAHRLIAQRETELPG